MTGHYRAVTSETFSTGRRHQHSITMILDCSKYASARDLSPDERSKLPNPQLVGVHSQLAVELISLLVSALNIRDGERGGR